MEINFHLENFFQSLESIFQASLRFALSLTQAQSKDKN